MRAPPDSRGGRRLRAATGGLETPANHLGEGQTTVPADPDRRLVAGVGR
jgi:hypothetical protein